MDQEHKISEKHYTHRTGWLRAVVLGANDGIISMAGLIVGVAAAHSSHDNILLVGIAGLVAGAISMAAGEYVSVSSQSDTEQADLARERTEHKNNIEHEREELAQIYVKRGLTLSLAEQVSTQLMAHDAIGAHARDELGISETISARPIQAAFASAVSFTVGAALPLSIVILAPHNLIIPTTFVSSLLCLTLLGLLSAHTGKAGFWKGVLRITFWGVIAMGVTAGIGTLFSIK